MSRFVLDGSSTRSISKDSPTPECVLRLRNTRGERINKYFYLFFCPGAFLSLKTHSGVGEYFEIDLVLDPSGTNPGAVAKHSGL